MFEISKLAAFVVVVGAACLGCNRVDYDVVESSVIGEYGVNDRLDQIWMWVQIQPGLKMIVGTEQIGVSCAG